MSARRITITPDGSVIVIRGWRVAELARQGGLKPTYAGTVGWMLDAKRLPDLIAWLDYRNVRYDIRSAAKPVAVLASPMPAVVPESEPGGLW